MMTSFTEQDSRLCMKTNKNGKSTSRDDVYPEFIKFAPDELILMITTFFNKILDTNRDCAWWLGYLDMPDDFK